MNKHVIKKKAGNNKIEVFQDNLTNTNSEI